MKKFKPFLPPLFLFFLVVAAYANSRNNGFVSDDISGIVQPAHTWKFPSVAVTKTVIHAQMLVWYVMYKLFGLAPWAFRLVNILSHAVSVLLVYAIVSRLTSRLHQVPSGTWLHQVPSGTWLRQRMIAFFAASLFAVHPLIIESVTWISGGIYAQYGMLFLLSFWIYIRYVIPDLIRDPSRVSEAQRDEGLVSGMTRQAYFLSLIFFLLSLLFSEKASVLFLLFLLYEFCFGNLKEHWKKLLPYFMLSIGFIVFYIVQIPGRVVGVANTSGASNIELYNPLVQLPIAVTSYFELIVWPAALTLYHSEVIFSQANYIIRLLIFFGYCAGIAVTAFKNKKLCFWLFWFLIPLIPTLTPLKIAWIVAERYAYLSVIGLFVLIAYWFEWVIFRLYTSSDALRSQKKIHVSSVAGVFSPFIPSLRASEATEFFSAPRALLHLFKLPFKGVTFKGVTQRAGSASRAHHVFHTIMCSSILLIYLALIVRTVVRNRDWTNEDTLWIATAQTSPSNPYSWNNMGDVYSRHGDNIKAAEMFERAIGLNPNYADPYHNLGEAYRSMGEIGDAILMYQKALSLNPALWQSHKALAGIYYSKKDYKQALFHVGEALKIVPDNRMLQQAAEDLQKLQ